MIVKFNDRLFNLIIHSTLHINENTPPKESHSNYLRLRCASGFVLVFATHTTYFMNSSISLQITYFWIGNFQMNIFWVIFGFKLIDCGWYCLVFICMSCDHLFRFDSLRDEESKFLRIPSLLCFICVSTI